MLSIVRTESRRFVGNQLRVKPIIQSVNSATSRQFSLLSQTHTQVNQCKWKQSQLRQIPFVYLRYRFYSTDGPDENRPTGGRSLPKLVNDKIVVSPPLFSWFKHTFKILKIRNSLDAEFSIDDFIEGSKTAVEVISDKLASCDFDGLRGLMKDDIIDNLQPVITSWTDEQRAELRVIKDDICNIHVSDIQIQEDDDGAIVDISMIYHLVKGYKQLTSDGTISPVEFIQKSSKFLDDNFFILNYKFTKEFSKDSDNDWIVSYVNHVNILDEMCEQTKAIEEMMKKNREKFEAERKKKK